MKCSRVKRKWEGKTLIRLDVLCESTLCDLFATLIKPYRPRTYGPTEISYLPVLYGKVVDNQSCVAVVLQEGRHPVSCEL